MWLLIFLSILSLALGKLISGQIAFCRFYLDRLNFYYLAKSAVEEAILERRNDITSEYDSLYELRTTRNIEFDNGTVSYYLFDEESKVNINRASKEVLARLPGITNSLAENIIDARSESEFKVIEDILKVEGIDRNSFYGGKDNPGVRDFITVYGRGSVNINTAPEDILLAVIGESSIVEEIVDFREGIDREDASLDDGVFFTEQTIGEQLNALSARDMLKLNQLIQDGSLVLKSARYTIKISARQPNKRTANFQVVYFSGDNVIKLWREE